ncbi:hypothetical protein [Burkholderia gladioli]|uniref:hypothetical protein n=1 Tax=Burkholderia gladioli TaxID=28095 RepID=UPI000CDA5F1A|nr:hypothetical protein [Burkholderia gladioli]POS10202.1 hypothetical protein C3Y08_01785 [Burkholderia gladioli]
MSGNLVPESGVLAELAAKVDALEIALVAALAQQTKEQRKAFKERFELEIAARESINRSTDDPLAWKERLAPHAKKLLGMLR